MNPNDPRVVGSLLRQDFGFFAAKCFRTLNPGVEFSPGWHIHLIAAELAGFRAGSRRLIINLPPRHLKSLLGSVALPAWLLGHTPSMQIICASYGGQLAEKLSRDCRTIMDSPWYREVFPNTRLNREAVNELTTTAHGCRVATSVDGVLTGRGANLIIIDDPLKPDDAISDALRRRTNDWYDGTLYSRLNDKRRGSILVIMQRLHEDDLAGHLMAQGGWDTIILPAIAEHDETYVVNTILGEKEVVGRKEGEALHPAREDLETIGEIRKTIKEYHFAGQYQQRPAPREGGMIKRAWFKSYKEAERPKEFELVLESWDTANKPTELSDFSVCTTWGLIDSHIYLLHVLRKKLNYPDLKRAVREQAEMHRPEVVLIEDRASGTQLIQELIQEGMYAVKAYQPGGMDKEMRMNAQTATIENGFVHVPETAEWLDLYLHELTTFPAGLHDDQVDSTSQALHWIKTSVKPVPAIIQVYDMRIRELGLEPPKATRLAW